MWNKKAKPRTPSLGEFFDSWCPEEPVKSGYQSVALWSYKVCSYSDFTGEKLRLGGLS